MSNQRTTLRVPKLKAPLDTDYDPAVPDPLVEDTGNKRKSTTTISFIGNKKRKIEPEKKDQEAVRLIQEIQAMDSQLARLNELELMAAKSPTTTLPIRLKTPKPTPVRKTPKKKKKNFSDDDDELDELDEEDDMEIIQMSKQKQRPRHLSEEEEDDELLSDEDADYDVNQLYYTAGPRPKRETKPSVKKLEKKEYLKHQRMEKKRRQQAQEKMRSVGDSTGEPIVITPGFADSGHRSKGGARRKPVFPPPPWDPIKSTARYSKREAMDQCKRVLGELMKRPEAIPFLKPVDAVELGILDYPTIITQPMDLGTVSKRMRDGAIKTVDSFCEKVRLIWSNAIKYNGMNHEIGGLALQLSAVFEARMKPILEAETSSMQNIDVNELRRRLEMYNSQALALRHELEELKNKGGGEAEKEGEGEEDQSPALPVLAKTEQPGRTTYSEKCALYNSINGLRPSFHRGLYQIIQEEGPSSSLTYLPDYIEVDPDVATASLLRRLQLYVKACEQVLNNKSDGGKKPQAVASAKPNSAQSSSTSSDSDSEASGEDARDHIASFSSIFEGRIADKTSPKMNQSTEERKISPVISTTANSASWSLENFDKQNRLAEGFANKWSELRNRKTQLDQLEREKEEQELLKEQRNKLKEEENAKRIQDELNQLKRQAELTQSDLRTSEEEAKSKEIAKLREAERARREKELSSFVTPVNMMEQFESMQHFQSSYLNSSSTSK